MKPIQVARPPWSGLVAVCGKCARKAGRKRLTKELKHAAKASGIVSRTRFIEVGCLDLCPKRRLVVASAHDLAETRLTIFPGDAKAEDIHQLLRARGDTASD